ncbi:MAG TPA: GNAT family N-acetyltransferase [Egibacteraceae bacterium]|nr:GNAT family N-acetyltransferase [Egibacteraceae bacterium]
MGELAVTRLDRASAKPVMAQVAGLSARAFDDYPFMRELFPGEAGDPRRAGIARRFYAATVADCLAHGVVEVALDGDRLAGYCAWLRPGAYPMPAGRTVAFLPAAATALRRYPRRARLVAQALARVERPHPDHPEHWYLAAIAVDPADQGRGVGARLIAPGLRRADDGGEPCFLETTRPTAKDWYTRLGFAVQHAEPAFEGGPLQWFQWRDPQRRRR